MIQRRILIEVWMGERLSRDRRPVQRCACRQGDSDGDVPCVASVNVCKGCGARWNAYGQALRAEGDPSVG